MSDDFAHQHATTKRALLAWASFLGFGHVAYGALLVVVGEAHDRAVRRDEPSYPLDRLYGATRCLYDGELRGAREALRDSVWRHLDVLWAAPPHATPRSIFLRHVASTAVLAEALRGRP